jgi:L-arabinokinase
MSIRRLAFYISGHGFGHASRALELIEAIARRCRDVSFLIRTAVPIWLFERSTAAMDVQPAEVDTGVVQLDSLHLDEEATARRAADFHREWDRRVAEEAAWLREGSADIVVGDIPALAFAAATRARLPSIAVGNFTWDWIYSAYPAFESLAPDVIPAIRRAYAGVTRALRLPLHGGFDSMTHTITDIPFIARRSTRDPRETRRILGAADGRPLVLTSFGMYGVDLPYERVSQSHAFTLLTVERHPPAGLAYQDLVAAADIVVSKPGYGIISECVANRTALLYTPRGRFAEYDVFVAEMPRVVRCRCISNETLFSGEWEAPIAALLAQPEPPPSRIDGADIAAQEILNLRVASL